MNEGMKNMMLPERKNNKIRPKAKTSVDVLDVLVKPPKRVESNLDRIPEKVHKEIVIDTLTEDKS